MGTNDWYRALLSREDPQVSRYPRRESGDECKLVPNAHVIVDVWRCYQQTGPSPADAPASGFQMLKLPLTNLGPLVIGLEVLRRRNRDAVI
jgi:hypothetical protein